MEILTYKSLPTIPERGKGYKEMEIIEYAFQHSEHLSKADIIVKATGRLKLLNIASVVNYFIKKKAKHFISSWMSVKVQTSDSRFFFCSPDYLKYFITYKKNISLHKNFESNLALSITNRNKSLFRFIFPKVWYNIRGIGGGYGCVYYTSKNGYRLRCLKSMVYHYLFKLGYWPTKIIQY